MSNRGCLRLYISGDTDIAATCSVSGEKVEASADTDAGMVIQGELVVSGLEAECVSGEHIHVSGMECSHGMDVYTSVSCQYTIRVNSFSYGFDFGFES